MAKENDAYAICTAQKKKSGMGHDAWKRCVDKVKKEESIMKFSKRVISILEKKKIKEKMGNKEGGTNATVDQPEGEDMDVVDDEDTLGEEVDCTARANAVKARTGSAAQAQSEYNRCKKEQGDDNRDDDNPANQKAKEVMQRGSSFTKRGKFGEAKDWINKAADSIEDRGTEGKCTPITKKGCTGRAEALAKTFKKIGKKRDAAIVSKKEKAAKKK